VSACTLDPVNPRDKTSPETVVSLGAREGEKSLARVSVDNVVSEGVAVKAELLFCSGVPPNKSIRNLDILKLTLGLPPLACPCDQTVGLSAVPVLALTPITGVPAELHDVGAVTGPQSYKLIICAGFILCVPEPALPAEIAVPPGVADTSKALVDKPVAITK
jgi:hypothetical protein